MPSRDYPFPLPVILPATKMGQAHRVLHDNNLLEDLPFHVALEFQRAVTGRHGLSITKEMLDSLDDDIYYRLLVAFGEF